MPMDDEDRMIADLLQAIGWSRSELARRLRVHENIVQKWATGKRSDERVRAWLTNLEHALAEHPLPEGWVLKDETEDPEQP